MHFKLIFTMAIVSASLLSEAQSRKTFSDLRPVEFKAKMDEFPEKVLLDLRTPDELSEGVIKNAEYIDYFEKDFEQRIQNLDKSKVYFLYCASGARSGETKELMEKKGFTTVFNLQGGMNSWKKARLPVERISRP